MFKALTENLVADYKNINDFDAFKTESLRVLGVDPKIEAVDFNEGEVDDLVKRFQEQTTEHYNRKKEQITQLLYPVIKNVYENQGHQYKRIALPFTDGRANPLPIAAELEEGVKSEGKSVMDDIEKAVALSLIDDSWKEHLRNMDELKDSVQSASFEQKDPLVIYKMEAYQLFEELIYKINEEVCSYLSKGKLLIPGADQIQEARTQKTDLSKTRTSRASQEEQAQRAAAESAGRSKQKVETFVRSGKKVGRNDPCPCGSGKKYKQCHGRG
jgi:preprotein translocase subunit SecA